MKWLPTMMVAAGVALATGLAQAAGGSSGQSSATTAPQGQSQGQSQDQSYGADNTGRNKMEQGDVRQNAGDQSNASDAVDLTARIRQAITADDSLSMDAHNIKIITENGKVTLRGPVASEAERRKVEAIAKKAAGSQTVINKLDVKKS